MFKRTGQAPCIPQPTGTAAPLLLALSTAGEQGCSHGHQHRGAVSPVPAGRGEEALIQGRALRP